MIRSLITILILIVFIGCKTGKNGYYPTACQRHDLKKMRINYINTLKEDDTFVLLRLSCSGCIQGSEKDLFIFKKQLKDTKIDRISNFRKFKSINVSDSVINWNEIILNINSYINDTIREYKEITGGDKVLFQGPASHGNVQGLDICFGKIKHSVFLGPLVDGYNIDNKNVYFIRRLSQLVNGITWIPIEKIKTKMKR